MPTPADVPTTPEPVPGVPAEQRPPDEVVAPPGLLSRPAASPSPTITQTSRITRTQQSEQGPPTPFDLRCVRHPSTAGLHQESRPSLQLYPDGTFYCFGRHSKDRACRKGGTIFDFAAASWSLGTRGNDFLELRQRLATTFGLTKAGRASAPTTAATVT